MADLHVFEKTSDVTFKMRYCAYINIVNLLVTDLWLGEVVFSTMLRRTSPACCSSFISLLGRNRSLGIDGRHFWFPSPQYSWLLVH